MRKSITLFFPVILFLLLFSACAQQKTVDDEAANKIKDAIIAAENGEQTGGIQIDTDFFHSSSKEYGYTLLTGDTALPSDESGLRAAIDLIAWWCDPAEQVGEDVETAYLYVGVCLVNNENECYDIAFGTYVDGEFKWMREFAVDFQASRIFELNVNTLEYVEIYTAK